MKQHIEAILVKHDPAGLINIGAPLDEYSSEAQMISEALEAGMSIYNVQYVVHSVFHDQFRGIGVGTLEDYRAIAQDIYPLLKNRAFL
jgi:hypothetical protein